MACVQGCGDWGAFITKLDADPAFKRLCDTAKRVSEQTMARDAPQEDTTEDLAVSVKVKRIVTVLNEAELATALGVSRVAKSTKARLATIEVKKPDDSGAETLFAFRHPDYPHRLAELCVSQGVCARTQHLAGTESCWAGEGEAHLRSVSSGLLNDINIHSIGQKIHNRALRTVDDFVTSVRPTKDTKAPSSSRAGGGEPERGSDSDDSGDSGDASDSDAELHGVAAAEFRVLAQATPDKRRPPVPSFAASSPPAGGPDVSTSARSKPPVAASSASS